jgi:hypothetical protein
MNRDEYKLYERAEKMVGVRARLWVWRNNQRVAGEWVTNYNVRHRDSGECWISDLKEVPSYKKRPLPGEQWFISPYGFAHGDYSGDLLCKSNLRSFLLDVDEECAKQKKTREDFGVFVVYADFGHSELFLQIGKGMKWGQWLETLQSEEPVYDEQDYYEVEDEARRAYFDDSINKELREWLAETFTDCNFEGVTDTDMFCWFMTKENGAFMDEGHGDSNMYCRWENVVKGMAEHDLFEMTGLVAQKALAL